MLKTNSKKAKQNIMLYIKSDVDYLLERAADDNIQLDITDDKAVCTFIWDIFNSEKPYSANVIRKRNMNYYDVFEDWAQGLALGGMFDYYYNLSAVDILGDILEETAEEKTRFTETQAEKRLTQLIFNAIYRNI